MVRVMTTDQMTLLQDLSSVFHDGRIDCSISPEIEEEARAHAVLSLLKKDYQVLSNNLSIINSHAEITELLNGIPFVTFKGYASAMYYPIPHNRQMGDVDVITSPESHNVAVQRLLDAGWKMDKSEHERHVSFCKGKAKCEIHIEIKGVPNGLDGIKTNSLSAEKRVRELLQDLIETSRVVESEYGPIVVPDEFHHALIMLLHVAGHMINDGGIGLRHLCDWSVFVSKVDVRRFEDDLRMVGLWTFARQLTSLCSEYLGLEEQSWSGNWDRSFLQDFMEDILQSGNFGSKQAGRRVVLEMEKTSFADVTKKRYPRAKNRLLLPYYMVKNCARYSRLVIKKKKRIIRFSTIKEAKKRSALYDKFKLFEDE